MRESEDIKLMSNREEYLNFYKHKGLVEGSPHFKVFRPRETYKSFISYIIKSNFNIISSGGSSMNNDKYFKILIDDSSEKLNIKGFFEN